jgi:hypothetical protein
VGQDWDWGYSNTTSRSLHSALHLPLYFTSLPFLSGFISRVSIYSHSTTHTALHSLLLFDYAHKSALRSDLCSPLFFTLLSTLCFAQLFTLLSCLLSDQLFILLSHRFLALCSSLVSALHLAVQSIIYRHTEIKPNSTPQTTPPQAVMADGGAICSSGHLMCAIAAKEMAVPVVGVTGVNNIRTFQIRVLVRKLR